MGSQFHFACPECGYQVEASGGLDFGMICATHTVSCPICREVSDLEISDKPWEIAATPGEAGPEDWVPPPGARIRCALDRRHSAKLWTHPGPCPRCGTVLLRSGPTILWD